MPVNQVLKEGQGAKPVKTKSTPAWLSGGGAGAGGGNKNPTSIPGWQEPMQNTGVTDRRILDDNAGGGMPLNMSNMLPGGGGAPSITPSPFGGPVSPRPQWAPPVGPTSRTNPLGQVKNNNNNSNNNVDPSTYTGTAGYSAPYNAAQNPATMIPTYQGEPVNNSMSDTLRSMTPVTRGNGPTLSDYLRSIQSGAWTPATTPMSQQKSRYGFGSSYGGNWGGGGGGGWGGGDWGGGGDADRAAWINYMQGLYSWNIK